MKTDTPHLKRALKNRHIQLIALGGAIGTGLFLGSAGTIQMAGPAVLLSYAVGGFIAFLIMRQLGEMMAQEPVAGSFSNLAHKYWGDFPGLLSGWNYWILYVLVGMSELTAVAVYVQYWFPQVEPWQTTAFFFLCINAINLAQVGFFGEMEFWFAVIKVVAIVLMIALGCFLLASGQAGPEAGLSNLWTHGGFFPNGWAGVVTSLAVVAFSFGGLELVGIAAAETDNPRKTIPKAINQLIYRILLFYIGALAVLLSLHPWNMLGAPVDKSHWAEAMIASPFVQIFDLIGIPSAAGVLNFVVLTAALSVYNSCVYCNSRMLYGLSLQGNAPKALGEVSARGVPVYALLVSSGATLVCVLLNYFMPKSALGVLMGLVVAALVINWAMISLTHLKFRAAKERAGEALVFKAFWHPFSNYLCLAFMVLVLAVLVYIGEGISVLLAPLWIGFVWLGYRLKCRRQGRKAA
ncbi:amino acid permease [uncultured Desulfovibrio sp.]|uniref:amino acid permease n=1 Tax=uncultured Desulfovibrio sp. TaxID=167968 RepID=UPI00266BCC92|nr:amino acid permease [uncultured Desulfovibrio sp.]